MTRLNKAFKVHTLAADLGLPASAAPVDDILAYCERRTRRFLKEFPSCTRPAQLLDILATQLHTKFEVITSVETLKEVQQRYVKLGETGFATLDTDLTKDVFGITFRRQHKKPWEPDYVSVIDARGEKQYRANYTKWHELGHLLILTDQLRLTFTRTSCTQDFKDPEESLVDAIAGHFAFWPPLFDRKLNGPITFEAIEQARVKLCPEASKTSALLGFVRRWPRPCILMEARVDLKKEERLATRQGHLGFHETPKPALRVRMATVNDAAQAIHLRLHPHWRVPRKSVIHKVFQSGKGSEMATENLSWWETSTGGKLRPREVRVEARVAGDSVQALITLERD